MGNVLYINEIILIFSFVSGSFCSISYLGYLLLLLLICSCRSFVLINIWYSVLGKIVHIIVGHLENLQFYGYSEYYCYGQSYICLMVNTFLHVVLYLLVGFLIHIFCFSRDSQRAFQCGYTSAHHQKKRISAFPPPPQTWHWLSFSFCHSDEWLVVPNCIFDFPLPHNYINPLVFCLCPYLGFLSFSHSFVEILCIVWIYSAGNKVASLSLSYTLLFTLPVESFDKRSC